MTTTTANWALRAAIALPMALASVAASASGSVFVFVDQGITNGDDDTLTGYGVGYRAGNGLGVELSSCRLGETRFSSEILTGPGTVVDSRVETPELAAQALNASYRHRFADERWSVTGTAGFFRSRAQSILVGGGLISLPGSRLEVKDEGITAGLGLAYAVTENVEVATGAQYFDTFGGVTRGWLQLRYQF